MTLHLSIVLFFTGLTGIHSITTVSKVSVKAGGSISIPCLYDHSYKGHVKYLCEGYYWNSCYYAVKMNQPDRSGKFFISDIKEQKIVTVTIKNLMEGNTDYWCAVEKNSAADVGTYFHLLVTRNMKPQLYVDHQEMTGFKGENIKINCHYSILGKIQWCMLGGPCVKGQSGSIYGTKVTISEYFYGVFTVTMFGLRTESSGWYLCVRGDLQMPVHVTITERPTTTARPTTPLTTFSNTPEPANHTVTSADNTTITTESGHHRSFCKDQSVSIYTLTLIISLTVLIFIILMTLLMWFILKRCKRSSAQSSPAPATSHAEADVDVIYSTVTRSQQPVQMVEAGDDSVTYSAVVQR